MDFIQSLLAEGYFALFLIIAIAYVIGRIKVKGVSLDVSAVIFVALVLGHFGVTLPKVIQDIGLVLFIFTIGIQAGPGFFDALKKHGIKLATLSVVLILSAGAVTVAMHYLSDYDMGILAGLLAGALTSTPGLAAADSMTDSTAPSVAYATIYPVAMVFLILAVQLIAGLFAV